MDKSIESKICQHCGGENTSVLEICYKCEGAMRFIWPFDSLWNDCRAVPQKVFKSDVFVTVGEEDRDHIVFFRNGLKNQLRVSDGNKSSEWIQVKVLYPRHWSDIPNVQEMDAAFNLAMKDLVCRYEKENPNG